VTQLARSECEPILKVPKKAKKRSGVKSQRGGTAAAYKRRATTLWGQVVHQRDKVCQVCGKADGKLDAHHVMVREFNATRAYLPNGMLVCFKHHQKLHGDPFWAVQVYTQRFGADGYEALRRKAYDGVGAKYGVDFWRGEMAFLTRLLEGRS
jgi:hypothetical protein